MGDLQSLLAMVCTLRGCSSSSHMVLTNSSWYNMSAGIGVLCAATFANSSASMFSLLGMRRKVKAAKCFSILCTAAKYLISSGSFAVNSFLTCPTITCESDLTIHLLTPRALSFHNPRSTTSYLAMLLVVRNSSLVA